MVDSEDYGCIQPEVGQGQFGKLGVWRGEKEIEKYNGKMLPTCRLDI